MPHKKVVKVDLVPIEVYRGGKWVPGRLLGLPVNTIYRFCGKVDESNLIWISGHKHGLSDYDNYQKGWVCLSVTEGIQAEGSEEGVGTCEADIFSTLKWALFIKVLRDVEVLMGIKVENLAMALLDAA